MKRSILLTVLVLAIAGCTQLSEPASGSNNPRPAVSVQEIPARTSESDSAVQPVAAAAQEILHEEKSAAGAVQAPLISLSGHYRDHDGRVQEHRFPVEFKLHADGKVTGTYEWWIEKRFEGGKTSLIYRTDSLSGRWIISGNTIQITTEQALGLPPLTLQEMNGLRITILNKN